MTPPDDWLVEWMDEDATGHEERRRRPPSGQAHEIYSIQCTPRRRRRRRRCCHAVESFVNQNSNMSHLIEPNDHDRCRLTSARRRSSSSSLMTVVLGVLLVTSSVAGFSASALKSLDSQRIAHQTGGSEAYRPLQEKEICQSLDIRNRFEELDQLSGCRVVEGFVQISLMGQNETRPDLSYPMLREITGYLLFFRVQGLRSIGQLFPNLTVIRGQQLFFDFSLVVFELMQLQEIGLRSLTMIQRGSVFIERNPNLCYVNTIDWARIAHAGRFDLKMRDNSNACPRCPNHCPSGGDGRRLCWSADHCQKVCDKCDGGNGACRLLNHWTGGTSREQLVQQPGARQAETECCHSECVGGCTGPLASQCDACRNVFHEGECRSSCPPGFYLYMKRRCVKDFECVSMPAPREAQLYGRPDANWKYWEDECTLDCPAGFREQNVTYNETITYKTCVKCEGTCDKVCDGTLLNNIETVQRLRGCTTINGNLEMQIKGGDSIVKELERSLGDIVVINGQLKISRSFPLVSLGFFRNLRNITAANALEHGLIVQDNQNLQRLWPKNHKITINKKLMFHFNPQLCMSLIEELVNTSRPADGNATSAPPPTVTDISPWSNGDKAACDEGLLSLSVYSRRDKLLMLQWNNFRANLTDRRLLLGYIISYIEAPYQNVSYYDGRNACGGDGWSVHDVPSNPDPGKSESYIITKLKPYTQYAIYVQTYTVAPQSTGKREGARSPIIYERTLSADPDPPANLRATATSSSELFIEWDVPVNPNGIVTHYIVKGVWGQDDQEYVDTLDSCADQSYSVETKSKADKEESPLTAADNRTSIFGPSGASDAAGADAGGQDSKDGGAKCECSEESKVSLQEKEKEQNFRIDFENFLHNKIFVRHQVGRSKRSVADEATADNSIQDGIEFPANANEDPTKAVDEFPHNLNASEQVATIENRTNAFYRDRLIEFTEKVTGTSYTVTGLRHYTEYNIQVYACHDPGSNPMKNIHCSLTSALTSARTKQNDFADEIPAPVAVLELNYTSSSAKIMWNEPIDPNGVVIKYQIEYKRTDLPNAKTKRECVRRKEYTENNMTRVLFDLTPGNYCVQVRAFTLSGSGPLTRETCFVMEDVRSSLSTAAVVGVLVLVLIVFLASAGAVSYYYRRKNNGIFSNNPDYHAYIPDGWEVERNDVKLVRELGKGSFGMVYEGVLHKTVSGGAPEAIKCAVKTVNERATIPERMQFLNEANVMKEFSAHHVVKLLGVVSKGQPTFVIMELMANGDLNSYLRSHRPNSDEYIEGRQPPTLKCVLKMAIEIADGMAYLADKKFVHRDLAARNCMVAEDLTVKIGDFGMTRDIYETDYYRKDGQGLLPVRWMAPESIRDGVFTSQSDVWSYGVVLWEMATLSSRPYQGLANEQVLKYVVEGGVMERPEGCPDRLFNLMEMCWRFQAKHRPTFIDIIDDLLPDVPATFASVSFYHSDAGVSARSALKAHHEHDHRLLNNPATPLRGMMAQCDDIELEAYNDMDSVVSSRPLPIGYTKLIRSNEARDEVIDEETPLRTRDDEDGLEEPKGAVPLADEEEVDGEEDVSKYDEGGGGDDDHVPVLYPYDRRAYILVKSPGGNSANGANGGGGGTGSKSDGSKAGTQSVTSEDSKGSYVSNGSASNGYVMGILKQRRHNAEC